MPRSGAQQNFVVLSVRAQNSGLLDLALAGADLVTPTGFLPGIARSMEMGQAASDEQSAG